MGTQEGEEHIAEVVATNHTGHVVERMTGYVVKILEVIPSNPTADQLANLETFDQSTLQSSIDAALPALGLNRPTFALRRMPELHSLSREVRRMREKPLIDQTLQDFFEHLPETPAQVELTWHVSGRPMLTGDDVGDTAISLSHDDDYCLCIVGAAPTGCDMAPVTSRTQAEWAALLGVHNGPLVTELVQRGDPIDRAGTRIGAAVEAVQKAFDTVAPVSLRMGQWHHDAVTLIANTPESNTHVFTTPVPLWRHPERIVAFVASQVQPSTPTSTIAALKQQDFNKGDVVEFDYHRFRGRFDGPQDQPVFEHQFLVTFKECATRSRRVQFAHYPNWLGTMRENALLHIAPNLMAQLASGEWGMVTNWTDVRVVGEAMTGDIIQARLWADHIDRFSVRLCCDFARVLSGNRLERLAFCQQLTTSVRLLHRADPLREAFPPFLLEAFQVMSPRNDQATQLPELPEGLSRFDVDREKLQVQAYSAPKLLRIDEFDTSLNDANLVGNIYYAQYFTWLSGACDSFLHKTAPEMVTSSDPIQEFLVLRSRMDFMRDAFPFDRIRLEMHARSVTDRAAALQFDFYRIIPDGPPEKLAVGETDVVWVRRTANGSPAPAPFPDAVRRAFEDE